MDAERLEALKKRFDFDAWRGINRLDRELVVRRIALTVDLVAGLDPARVREIDPGDGTRLLRVVWRVPKHEDAVLVMDVRECSSREAAHHVLLELLDNMQAPDVKRLEDTELGDVAFARDATTGVALARGNIAISIRNGGKTVVPVEDVAKAVDRWIMRTDN